MTTIPEVLFVCVRNSGKSQMAAALMRHRSGERVRVFSAGTHPGRELNAESVAALAEIGVDVGDEHPKPIDSEVLSTVDRVIVLGDDASVDNPAAAPIERWHTDEPSTRGIHGIERMRLIRDDIEKRVVALTHDLS